MSTKPLTNTSIAPVGHIDGYPIMPCVKSGFCCTRSPCAYGEWNADKSACAHLQPPNELGQRDCGKYDWIKENVEGWEMYPAFGGGCGASLYNEPREAIIQKLIELNK